MKKCEDDDRDEFLHHKTVQEFEALGFTFEQINYKEYKAVHDRIEGEYFDYDDDDNAYWKEVIEKCNYIVI
jgi:hypothetical protein